MMLKQMFPPPPLLYPQVSGDPAERRVSKQPTGVCGEPTRAPCAHLGARVPDPHAAGKPPYRPRRPALHGGCYDRGR